ncbi:MAG: CoA ester lyase [Nitrososphaerales archaeon]|nr:CoA ester lyase [Nitrososphaerales archaeon]
MPATLKLKHGLRSTVLRRSQLYVPGNNERMMEKASGLEADSVILDLEDAVPEEQKEEALRLVARLSRELEWGDRELCVRVNARGSSRFAKELSTIKPLKRLQTIVLPKAEGDCSAVHARTGKGVIPIIETAEGLMNLREISRSRGIVALTYGAADYAASVGGSVSAYLDSEVLKTMIVAASRSARVSAVDNVFFDLNDKEGFRRQAAMARSLGFAGKQIVHPSQIPIANEVFSPTKAEVEWAERVLKEFQRASAKERGAVRVDGSLVDAVHYRLAKELLERRDAVEG